MVFTSSSRGSELGFLVMVFTPNHFTPSQTHLPRAAEGKQEAITHTGQTAEARTGPRLGKIYGKYKHLQIACELDSPNYEDKPTFWVWTGWTGHGSPWVCTQRHSGCSSHGHPSDAAARGRGLWSQSLQNMQHFIWDFSPCLTVFSVHRAYCVQANSGDCMCWGTAGKPVIYSNWTW